MKKAGNDDEKKSCWLKTVRRKQQTVTAGDMKLASMAAFLAGRSYDERRRRVAAEIVS